MEPTDRPSGVENFGFSPYPRSFSAGAVLVGFSLGVFVSVFAPDFAGTLFSTYGGMSIFAVIGFAGMLVSASNLPSERARRRRAYVAWGIVILFLTGASMVAGWVLVSILTQPV